MKHLKIIFYVFITINTLCLMSYLLYKINPFLGGASIISSIISLFVWLFLVIDQE